MNKFNFIKYKKNDVYEYHFSPKDNGRVITDTESYSTNKTLWDNWCKDEDMPLTFEKFNISNFSCAENILLYMLIISELTKEKDLYGIGIWQTDSIEEILNQEPILVKWEYKLLHEYSGPNEYLKNDIGYKKSKSPVIKQFGKPIQKTPINKTGLFKLDTFQNLADLLKVGFYDANNMTNFYASNHINKIKDFLTSNKVPVISNILNKDDLLIALLVGEDMGYYDYLLIKSKNDISIKIDKVINKIHMFVEFYIMEIAKVSSSDEMIKLIEKGLKIYDF